jgi:hypothetical protein
MKSTINKDIKRTEKVTLHCGEWRANFDKLNPTNDFTLWHIKGITRNDITVSRRSLEDLSLLVNELIKELESEE